MTELATLFATACLAGTLHGTPQEICKEISIAKFGPTNELTAIEVCTYQAPAELSLWHKSLQEVMPTATITIPFHRCTATSPNSDDED